MYHNGDGVSENFITAIKWYKLAAEQGNKNAQSKFGRMYKNGWGVIQDYVRAHMWFNIAASEGHKDATNNGDIVAKRMTPFQIENAQKLSRECVKKKYKGC